MRRSAAVGGARTFSGGDRDFRSSDAVPWPVVAVCVARGGRDQYFSRVVSNPARSSADRVSLRRRLAEP